MRTIIKPDLPLTTIENLESINDFFYFPLTRPLDHTMCECLDEWAMQKMPMDLLKQSIIYHIPIEIHGIYPSLFPSLAPSLHFSSVEAIDFHHNPSAKSYNFIRPQFYYVHNAKKIKKLIVAVTPGRDYIFQYAGLIRHCLSLLTNGFEQYLAIYRYPKLEETITNWTELNSLFIRENDIIIMGFAQEMYDLLRKKHKNFDIIEENINEWYCSTRIRIAKKTIINFFRVHYSFWGCMSGRLAYRFAELGCREVIYVGKLGTLSNKNEIYKKIFSPTRYFSYRYLSLINQTEDLYNPLASYFPELNTGIHLSVSTVAEEDFIQRHLSQEMGARSIDNEISQIAASLSHFNTAYNRQVGFSSLHFASDYLRCKQERGREKTDFDLSNNRTDSAKKSKQKMLEKSGSYLYEYLLSQE